MRRILLIAEHNLSLKPGGRGRKIMDLAKTVPGTTSLNEHTFRQTFNCLHYSDITKPDLEGRLTIAIGNLDAQALNFRTFDPRYTWMIKNKGLMAVTHAIGRTTPIAAYPQYALTMALFIAETYANHRKNRKPQSLTPPSHYKHILTAVT